MGADAGDGDRAPGQVFLPAAVRDAIIAHARDEAPRECCGLLLGDGPRIAGARPARNVRAGTTRYLIDPADHFAAIREAASLGLSIVGAYHSHPTSAPIPSTRDLREAAHDFIYLIAGLAEAGCLEVRAFRFSNGNFRPLLLVSLTGIPGPL